MVKPKVMTVCGTRPELVRLSEIIRKFDLYTNHIFVYTNQSYDYELSGVFFDELKIRKPDYSLSVKADSIGKQIGNILEQTESVILKEKPDAILILGDTNSALCCIMAKRLKVVVYHMEAGNRCFDERVPEEINRRIVDHTSDINLCYTEHARRNLLAEGINSQDIFVIGSPLTEVYALHREDIGKSRILRKLKLTKDNYFLASVHREENVENKENLLSIFKAFRLLSERYSIPVILSAHPRTLKKIDDLKINCEGIIPHAPFGMFDYINLQKGAFCNLSDSGTIHEDAAILGIPSVNLRESNERPEVYDTGNVIMAGVDSDSILDAVELSREQINVKFDNPYISGNCSEKVVRLVHMHKIVRKRKYLCI